MDNEVLKPCPFCGHSEFTENGGADGLSWIECATCHADGPLANTDWTDNCLDPQRPARLARDLLSRLSRAGP